MAAKRKRSGRIRSKKKKLSRNGVPLGRPRGGSGSTGNVESISALRQVNVYLDATTHLRLKRQAIERDALLSMVRAGTGHWPDDVVPTGGVSGVVAQAIADYFQRLDADAAAAERSPRAKPKRATA